MTEQTLTEETYTPDFSQDLFALRRTGGPESYGNPYDPESLITGEETAAGITYDDPRVWPDFPTYQEAVAGRMTPEQIAQVAPRATVTSTIRPYHVVGIGPNGQAVQGYVFGRPIFPPKKREALRLEAEIARFEQFQATEGVFRLTRA